MSATIGIGEDLRTSPSALAAGHRHPKQLAAKLRTAQKLRKARLRVVRIDVAHRLHADRRSAANRQITDADLSRLTAH